MDKVVYNVRSLMEKIIDHYAAFDSEVRPSWFPGYWLARVVTNTYEIKYCGGSVCLDARCTRESLVFFEWLYPELTFYSAGFPLESQYLIVENAPF